MDMESFSGLIKEFIKVNGKKANNTERLFLYLQTNSKELEYGKME